MSTSVIVWIALVMLALATFSQWVLLRARYLDRLSEQRSRHAEQVHNLTLSFAQARKQIAQLQLDLGHARSQLARHAARQSIAIASRAQAPAPSRAEVVPAMPSLPADGFADTLPSPQYPHDAGALITTYPVRK